MVGESSEKLGLLKIFAYPNLICVFSVGDTTRLALGNASLYSCVTLNGSLSIVPVTFWSVSTILSPILPE